MPSGFCFYRNLIRHMSLQIGVLAAHQRLEDLAERGGQRLPARRALPGGGPELRLMHLDRDEEILERLTLGSGQRFVRHALCTFSTPHRSGLPQVALRFRHARESGYPWRATQPEVLDSFLHLLRESCAEGPRGGAKKARL